LTNPILTPKPPQRVKLNQGKSNQIKHFGEKKDSMTKIIIQCAGIPPISTIRAICVERQIGQLRVLVVKICISLWLGGSVANFSFRFCMKSAFHLCPSVAAEIPPKIKQVKVKSNPVKPKKIQSL
jgi:hypothetical protein